MNLAETDDHPPPASPRRRVVQICHKGAPGRCRRRAEARNINVSSRALRPGRGLCGRFGQTACVGRSGRASAGRAAGAAGAPTIAVTTSTTPLGPREHWSGKDPVTQPGPGRPNRSRGPRPSPGPASPSPNLRARGRMTGRGSANRPQNALSPPASPRPLPDEKDSAPPDVPGITFLAPKDAETCTSHSKVQFQPSFSRAKCTSRRRSGPAAAVADCGDDPAVHDDPGLQAAASGERGSM